MKALALFTLGLVLFSASVSRGQTIVTQYVLVVLQTNLTDLANVWSQSQIFNGNLSLHRPNTNTTSWLSFRCDSDSDPNEWQAIAPDYGNGNSFFVLFYDNKTLSDIVKVGTRYPLRNHTSIGGDIPTADTTLLVHDVVYPDERSNLVSAVRQTMSLYSQSNCISAVSAAPYADVLEVFRPTMGGAWINFAQGSRLADWRIGMVPGSYDLGFYCANGKPVSPSNPGHLIMRLTQTGILQANVPNPIPKAPMPLSEKGATLLMRRTQ